MDFGITKEQQALLDKVRGVMAGFDEAYFDAHIKNGTHPVEYTKALIDSGVALLGLPSEYGGMPSDFLTEILVTVELAKSGAPLSAGVLRSLHMRNILSFGNQKQIKEACEYALKGEKQYCFAVTEYPGSKTTFRRKNGKVYINGGKAPVSDIETTTKIMVMALDPEISDRKKAYTLWMVDKSRVRVEPGEYVIFDNVEVDESAMIGAEGMARNHLARSVELERIITSAHCAGAAVCALGDAVKYANTKRIKDKPIGTLPLIQEKLAVMAVNIENMLNIIYKAAWCVDRGKDLQLIVPLVKKYCPKAAGEVCDEAIQIMGGTGYRVNTRAYRIWNEIRGIRFAAGSDEMMTGLIAPVILEKYG